MRMPHFGILAPALISFFQLLASFFARSHFGEVGLWASPPPPPPPQSFPKLNQLPRKCINFILLLPALKCLPWLEVFFFFLLKARLHRQIENRASHFPPPTSGTRKFSWNSPPLLAETGKGKPCSAPLLGQICACSNAGLPRAGGADLVARVSLP